MDGAFGEPSGQTDFVEFAGRPPLMMVADGWQEIAEAIDSWLDGVLDSPVPTTQRASA